MSKEYFSHDYNARTDPKLVRMIMKSGLDSLAIYWCIIEMLYEQDGYINLDYIDNIAFELHTQSDRITDVLKNYDLFRFEEDKFYSDSVLRRLQLREEISQKNSNNAKSGWQKRRGNDATVMRPHSDRNAIKVKESKVNKRKEKIFIAPSVDEVKSYFKENGYKEETAIKMFNSYSVADWIDSKGNKVKNWKQKAINVWFTSENKSNGKTEPVDKYGKPRPTHQHVLVNNEWTVL